MSEAFPVGWNRAADKEKVIVLLISLNLPPPFGKYALYEWCMRYGVTMTADDVQRVTGRPAGEI